MRICHLGKYFAPASGGIESHVRSLATVQSRLGADVTVLCVNHLDAQGNDVTWRRFASTPDDEHHDGEVFVKRFGRRSSFCKWDFCLGLRGLSRRLAEFDVVHLHAPNPTMMLALFGRKLHCPLVVTHHSDIVKQRMLGRIFRPIENHILTRAACVLSTSPRYAEGSKPLQRFAGKHRVLPLGIDLAPFATPSERTLKYAREARLRFGAPLWLGVGRLVYYKGFENAVRMLPTTPGRLVLVGSGPLESSLRSLADSLGVSERITWMQDVSIEQLAGLYHAATALIMSSNSRSEGFGLVQVEAMASRCPVVNTEVPHSGVPWVSIHESTGLTVPCNDPAALSAAACSLASEPAVRDRLATNAERRALEQFSDQTMGSRSLRIYSDACRKTWPDSAHAADALLGGARRSGSTHAFASTGL